MIKEKLFIKIAVKYLTGILFNSPRFHSSGGCSSLIQVLTEDSTTSTVKSLMHVRVEQKVEREEVVKVTGTNKDETTYVSSISFNPFNS